MADTDRTHAPAAAPAVPFPSAAPIVAPATAVLELSVPVALRLLGDLLGRPVTGREISPVGLLDDRRWLRGVFVDDDGPAAVYLFEPSLAAAAAAALVMLPPHVAGGVATTALLPPELAEHTPEILNVATRLINRAGGTHYRLTGQVLPGEPSPPEVLGVLQQAGRRVDLRLHVEGYGGGVLVILVR